MTTNAAVAASHRPSPEIPIPGHGAVFGQLKAVDALVERTDLLRLDASRKLDPKHRVEMGQFLTPAPVARLMASMFRIRRRSIRLLDAGAGAGSLAAAFVAETCRSPQRLESLALTAYEKDTTLAAYLNESLRACQAECHRSGIHFSAEALREDFIEAGASMLGGNLFSQQPRRVFDCAILNPPYRKIHSASEERKLLRSIGIETSNLYTGFLSIVLKLLDQGGELVAITPRSFCNGPYFRPFRRLLLETMTLRRIHVFESRDRAFQGDQVLQENIIFYAVKRPAKQGKITISSSEGADGGSVALLEASYHEVVLPNDPNYFIRLVTDELDRRIARRMASLSQKLEDLGLAVSTGRVVDFRAKRFLRRNPGENTVPLIYPGHFDAGFVRWPKPEGKKPNALVTSARTEDLLVPADTYVLARRFSAKEERRRVVAAVFSPDRVPAEKVGFENHLNYYHRGGAGLSPNLAKGLAAFLNSTLLDTFFRQFNGHTQVNATDLRSLRYPNLEQLESLGSKIGTAFPDQDEIDRLIEEELISMADAAESINPVSAKKKIEEALAVLKDLGLPREQQNERSALTLLALLDLRPASRWAEAAAPLRGITEMMNFFSREYGKTYAPNTRETVRRHTVHQFVQAGLVARNPDSPSRPTNSPKTVYQIETIVLHLLRTYGSRTWGKRLKAYLSSAETLSRQYARERKMRRLPVRVAPGKTVTLSLGDHNALVKKILDDFCALFLPAAAVIYVGDTEKKWAYFDHEALAALGTTIEQHGKMPDVVVCEEEKKWLVLIEAVTSHGPMDAKRQLELRELFMGIKANLVFVTAFPDRRVLMKHLGDIAWETEVWIADSPTHLIHFDGERFLGPYEEVGNSANHSARSR